MLKQEIGRLNLWSGRCPDGPKSSPLRMAKLHRSSTSGCWWNVGMEGAFNPHGQDSCSHRLHIKPHCPSFSFQISQPLGAALHPKRNRDRDESGHSILADSPCLPGIRVSQHPFQTHWLHRQASRHPRADTHPALPFRVAPALLSLGGPHPLCSFTLYFHLPKEGQKQMTLAPGKHLQISRVR